jgi:hypothetical protein
VTQFETPSGLVFASRQVMDQGWPILNVTHDADDQHWQFINGWGDTEEGVKPILVHAHHVVDSTRLSRRSATYPVVGEPGVQTLTSEWTREPIPPDSE